MEITSDTTALVTGANGGIGAAIARAFKRAGAKVVITGRRADALEPLARELDAKVVVADLALREDARRLDEAAREVDVAVLNAALPSSGPLLEYTPEQIDRAVDVNLRAPIHTARTVAEAMVARGRGHIVFISSISGKVATGGQALYNATKFGLRGFAFALREDLQPHGVGVSTVFPGFIRDAGMFADAGVALPTGLGTRSPEEVAAAVLRAVRVNAAEIDVAAFEQVFAGRLFPLAPSAFTWLQRRLDNGVLAGQIAERQRHKR